MRFIILWLQILSLLFLNTFFGDNVGLKINAPEQIDAGKEIKIEITLEKGKITGFSRFQMELPNGLTATNIQSANADFSFKDQKVRYIWLRMPEEETITLSFSIKCNERLKGTFDLNGKLSYIIDNERKSVDLQPKTVAIVPNPAMDPNLLVDIKDFGKSIYQNASGLQIACVRQKPVTSDNKEYLVNILVNKESLKNYAKIEETVPKGYTAISVNSKDGVFSFKDGKVKFLWMNLPAEPYFTVSYKLIPINGEKNPQINGTFSYMIDYNSTSLPIVEKDADLANLTPDQVKSIILAPVTTVIASNSNVNTNIQNQNNSQTQNTVNDNSNIAANTNNTTTSGNNTNSVQQNTNTNKTSQVIIKNESDNADLLNPQTGISYRVQIAAGHKPINTKRYFKKYKLENTVIKEEHDGWLKYSLGAFSVYKDARDYRTHIWNTTTITDAFVSAYNDGKRITVQEALMIANQKWYK